MTERNNIIKLEDKQLNYVVYVLRQRAEGLHRIMIHEPLDSEQDMEIVKQELHTTRDALDAICKNKRAKEYYVSLNLVYGT